MKILIVDDEPAYRMLLKDALAEEGWDIVASEHGEDAIEELRKGSFDIIVSDVYMPIMDGIKFHQAVRTMPGIESIPFLFVSAYDDQFTLEAIKNPKIETLLRKGRSMRVLKDWIRYFTTPEIKRPLVPPSKESGQRSEDASRGRSHGGGSQTPTY